MTEKQKMTFLPFVSTAEHLESQWYSQDLLIIWKRITITQTFLKTLMVKKP